MSTSIITASLFLMTIAQIASAEELRLSMQEMAVIQSPESESRFLMDFGSWEAVVGEQIIAVQLVIPGASGLVDSETGVRVGPVATGWAGTSPTWTTPWTTPGGDWDDRPQIALDPEDGRLGSSLVFDLTSLVTETIDNSIPWNGLLLAPADVSKAGFDALQMPDLDSIGDAELVLRYRKLSAHGIEDGGQQLLERKTRSRESVDPVRFVPAG
jgi:hypothetical protein